MKTLMAALLLALMPAASMAQSASSEAEVRRTLQEFVQAFDNLDWDRFTSFFADDATMFQPRKFVSRAENKSEIEAQFKTIFPQIRGTQSKPPYMILQPQKLRIRMLGSSAALVTFQLDDRPGMLNRRTIIFQRIQSGWKIVHIHASELPQ